MITLGIDYGRRKIGLAIARGPLAEPLAVIRIPNEEEALERIAKVYQKEGVGRVVMGVSEGEMEKEERVFARKLAERLKTAVLFQDETLTTADSVTLARTAGVSRGKRQRLEDAFAASLMLQSFLERQNV